MASPAYTNVCNDTATGQELAKVEVDTEGKVTLTAVSLQQAAAMLREATEDLPQLR